jgi:ABC-type transport system involved in cytochrome c biogenesis permease subunit
MGSIPIPIAIPIPNRAPTEASRPDPARNDSEGRLAPAGLKRTFAAVFGLSDRHWFLGAVLLYGVAALFGVLVWRHGFRRDNRALYGLLWAGFALHTLALVARGVSLSRCPIRNLYEATTFLLWTIAVAYLLVGVVRKVRFLGVFVAPLLVGVGVFALMPALDAPEAGARLVPGWKSLHATFILLAYGAFGLGALTGGMYLMEANTLKNHKALAMASLLPPITRVEAVTGGSLLAGVGLLTAGLVTGIFYLKAAKGTYLSTDPFVLYSALTWLLYVGMVVARWRFDQRGRRLAMGAVAGFAFVLLTFWGIYLLSGLHRASVGNATDAANSRITLTTR